MNREERVPLEWTTGMSDEQAEKFRVVLLANDMLFDRFGYILARFHRRRSRPSTEKDFESPSWPYREAYRQGYLKAVEDLVAVIPEKHRPKHLSVKGDPDHDDRSTRPDPRTKS